MGEGGVTHYLAEPEDAGHANNGFTVRGVITNVFKSYTVAKGMGIANDRKKLIEKQLTMLLPAGVQPKKDVLVMQKDTPAGIIKIEEFETVTPVNEKLVRNGKTFLVPSLDYNERKNPTNELYLDVVSWLINPSNALNDKLVPSIWFLFANAYFAGGGCQIFADDTEIYSWAGGFKEWLKRKKGLNISGKGSRGYIITDDDAKILNENESVVIDEWGRYARYRMFETNCNTQEAKEKYKNGWTNAINEQVKEAKALYSGDFEKKNKIGIFYQKNKQKIFIGLAVIGVIITIYILYKKGVFKKWI